MEWTTVGSIKVDCPTRSMIEMMTPRKPCGTWRLEWSNVQWAHAVDGALRGGLILYIHVYRIIRTPCLPPIPPKSPSIHHAHARNKITVSGGVSLPKPNGTNVLSEVME